MFQIDDFSPAGVLNFDKITTYQTYYGVMPYLLSNNWAVQNQILNGTCKQIGNESLFVWLWLPQKDNHQGKYSCLDKKPFSRASNYRALYPQRSYSRNVKGRLFVFRLCPRTRKTTLSLRFSVTCIASLQNHNTTECVCVCVCVCVCEGGGKGSEKT